MTDKEAMAMALEALEYIDDGANNQGAHIGISWRCVSTKAKPAIAALKERLLPDPMREVQRLGQEIEPKIGCVNHDCDQCKAQPEQTNTRPYYTIDELNAWADEKEKQAWRNAAIRIGEELSSVGPDGYYDMTAQQWLDWSMAQEPRGKNSLAQPEQEPVAWLDGPHLVVRVDMRDRLSYKGPWVDLGRAIPDKWTPLLYTHPPQRTWVGLTDEEINEWTPEIHGVIRAIEAKLKELNT